MLKKIVGLTIACIILLTVAAGGTWAYASDTGKSSANQIKAAQLTLLTGTSPDGGITVNYSSGLTQTLNIPALKPTQSTPSTTIYLKNNNASIYGSGLNVRFTYAKSVNGAVNVTADSLAAILQITTLDYNRTQNLISMVTDYNGNGYVDLQDLMTATNSPNSQLNGLAGINAGLNKTFVIQLMMRNTLGNGNPITNINDFQGNGLNINMYFTLQQ